MEIAAFSLEVIKVVVWPVVILFVVFRYGHHLERFLVRFSEETEEVSSDFFGITAKMRRNLEQISNTLPKEQTQAKLGLEQANRELALEQFRTLAKRFMTEPLEMRIHIATLMEDLANALRPEDILTFSQSPKAGERVAAGIALRKHMERIPALKSDPNVLAALQSGIDDTESRVRYRFVQAIKTDTEVIKRFKVALERLIKEDGNDAVRHEAQRALARL
jgi:hypothetical protein